MGKPSPPLPRALRSALTPRDARSFLLRRVAFQLYESFYCRGGVVASTPQEPRRPEGDPDFVARLSAAIRGRGPWQPGWLVEAAERERLLVVREGVHVRVPASRCRCPDDPPRPGTHVSVAYPAALPHLFPGYFTILGDRDLMPDPSDLVVRLYLHIDERAVPELVSWVTLTLNSTGVPFRMKLCNDPGWYDRCDSVVLYLPAEMFRPRSAPLRQMLALVRADLRDGTPVFTKPLAPGVGLAEERGAATESFGMRRCVVLAEALLAAYDAGARAPEERLRRVLQHFAGAGIDVDAPYLERRSVDAYRL